MSYIGGLSDIALNAIPAILLYFLSFRINEIYVLYYYEKLKKMNVNLKDQNTKYTEFIIKNYNTIHWKVFKHKAFGNLTDKSNAFFKCWKFSK